MGNKLQISTAFDNSLTLKHIISYSKQTDHPMVAEAAVVGFPHEVKGQLI